MPCANSECSGGSAANGIAPVIELQVPCSRYSGPEPYAPSIIVKAIIDQATGGSAVEEETKGDGKIAGAGKVKCTVVGKVDIGTKASAKLYSPVSQTGIVGGKCSTYPCGGDGGGDGIGHVVAEFEMGDKPHTRLGRKGESKEAAGQYQDQ